MIQNDFKRHFETYKLPYKIVMFNHLDFCENLEQFTNFLTSLQNRWN